MKVNGLILVPLHWPLMRRSFKLVLVLVLLGAACGLNLSFARWGTGQLGTPILTFATEPTFPADIDLPGQFGLYTTPGMATAPWTTLVLGLVVPLLLIGLVAYFVIRPRPEAESGQEGSPG